MQLLVAGTAVLLFVWVGLSAWVIVGRARYNRRTRIASRDASLISARGLTARTWSWRRLWRIADGPFGDPSEVAAGELVRRDSPRLERMSRHGSFERTHALRVLARGESPVTFDVLAAARASGRGDVIAATVAIASELETPAADEFLLDVLVTGDHPRSRTATEVAPRVDRLRAELLELTRDPDAANRYWALMLLVNSPSGPGVREAALEGAGDAAASVRSAAARLLGAMGSPDVLPVVRVLLADDSFYVRAHSARVVGELQARPLAGEVAGLLADDNWWVRAAAKESLAMLGESGFKAATAMLQSDDRFACDGAAEVILDFRRLGAAGEDDASSELLERLAG